MKRSPIANVPMFDIPKPQKPMKEEGTFPGPRTIRRVKCAGGEHPAGLVIGNSKHLVWRPHSILLGAGSYPCPVVGRCLCQAPAPAVDGIHTPTCAQPNPEGRWAT